MIDRREVVLKNSLIEIERLSVVVDEFCQSHCAPTDLAFKFNLALDEIITNIVDYAFDDDAEHEIHVILCCTDGCIQAEVIDEGRSYNPLAAADPDVTLSIEDRPIGGLGVYFVRQMMDRVDYRRDGNRNCLRFARRIDPADESPEHGDPAPGEGMRD
ncbi:MAG: ATP-binding protein [Azospirillum sp.]|nr:ATP-binding protein [Azospirillum sp.]